MSMFSKSLCPVAVLALVLAVPAAAVAAPLSVSQARYVERSFQENSAGDFDYSIRGCFRVLARVDCVDRGDDRGRDRVQRDRLLLPRS